MTTKEKANAYDRALERAKKERTNYQKELDKTDKNSQLAGLLRAGISAIDMAFPELKESEDEQIREDIMEAVENYFPYERIEEIRAYLYLEKQKEKKPTECLKADRGGWYVCTNLFDLDMKVWHIQTWGAGTPHYLVSAKTKEDAWAMVKEEWRKKFNTTIVGCISFKICGNETYVRQNIVDLIEIKGLTAKTSLIIDLNENIF